MMDLPDTVHEKEDVVGHEDAVVFQVLWARLRALMNEAGATLPDSSAASPTFPTSAGMLFGGQSKEVFEEGLRFPPTLIQTAAGPNETFYEIIRANTRVPDEVIGDFHAMVAANETAIGGVVELLGEGELRDLGEFGRVVQARSEAAMRAAIRKVPPGEYRRTVFADGYDAPIRIECVVRVKDGEILVDYTGSSPEVPYPLNGVHNFTFAYTVYPLKCAIGPDIPNNSGTFRPFTVIAPEGSVLSAPG